MHLRCPVFYVMFCFSFFCMKDAFSEVWEINFLMRYLYCYWDDGCSKWRIICLRFLLRGENLRIVNYRREYRVIVLSLSTKCLMDQCKGFGFLSHEKIELSFYMRVICFWWLLLWWWIESWSDCIASSNDFCPRMFLSSSALLKNPRGTRASTELDDASFSRVCTKRRQVFKRC